MIKPRLISGIQPSGKLHLGNYLGALKNFVDLQNSGKYECYFFVADLHSLTEPFDPKEKQEQILELTADYLAAGLDAKKSVIFLQSAIPAHSELAWILSTITPLGELERMTQFKEKSSSQRQNANAGLFTYPTLMAADVLLYDAKFVPVGNDQDQHLELARTLARKFNKKFPARRPVRQSFSVGGSLGEGGGKTFVEPQALHTNAPRVMSLLNPEKKMSKSLPESCLFLDDEPSEIKKKIQRAVTDSGKEIKYDPRKKAGISNLLQIYAGLSGMPIQKIEKKFSGKTYSKFKSDLAELIINHFAPFRTKKRTLLAKRQTLVATLTSGSAKASKITEKKVAEVKKKIGIAI